MGSIFADFNFHGRQHPQKIILIISAKIVDEWVAQLDFPLINCVERKYPAKVSETQGNKIYLQSDRQTNRTSLNSDG